MNWPLKLQEDVKHLWLKPLEFGLKAEPRFFRSGYLGQPPGALLSEYEIVKVGEVSVRDEFLGTVVADSYVIKWKSVIDLRNVDDRHIREGYRFDALAGWQRSVQERRRQNRKMRDIINNPILLQACRIGASLRDELRDYYQTAMSYILVEGDWSEEQFLHYVIKHKTSRLAGTPWSKFFSGTDGEEYLSDRGREAYSFFVRTVRNLCTFLLKDSVWKPGGFLDRNSISPRYLYSSLRSRPGTLSEGIDVRSSLAKQRLKIYKYRDRNAAGIWVISQLGWPVFRDELKEGLYKAIYSIVRRYLPRGAPKFTPEEHKQDFYRQVKDGGYEYYDTSLAEKLEAHVIRLPFACHLTEPGLNVKYGVTKVSGGVDTRWAMFFAESVLTEAAIDTGYFRVDHERLGGGDNFGTRYPIHYDDVLKQIFAKTYRILGHDEQGEVGLKLVRDGAKTHEMIANRFVGYRAVNRIIPATSLGRVLISLGLTSIKYWDLFEELPYELEDFEAGGPHGWFERRKQLLTQRGKDHLKMALEEVDLEPIQKSIIVDDIDAPVPYVFDVQPIPKWR